MNESLTAGEGNWWTCPRCNCYVQGDHICGPTNPTPWPTYGTGNAEVVAAINKWGRELRKELWEVVRLLKEIAYSVR